MKKIFLSILACAAMLVGCTIEEPVNPGDLDVNVVPSLLNFDGKTAGSAEVEVTARASWTVSVPEAAAEWLTINPASGGAGTQKVTVSVLVGGDAARSAEVVFKAGNDKKILTVNQEGGVSWGTLDNPYTCAKAVEFCATLADKAKGPKEVYVKGIITKIVEKYGTTYGNATFFMSDDGTEDSPQFEVYRALYFDNQKYDDTSKQNINVGDHVMVYGMIMNYGGQAETSQNEAYLISLEAGTNPTLTCAKAELTVPFAATSASFDIEANNISAGWTASTDAAWITDYTKAGNNSDKLEVKFEANSVKEARTATFTVKAAGVKDLVLTLTQEPFSDITNATCAEVNAQPDGSALFRITGVVSEIVMDKNDPTKYNAYGNFYVTDATGTVYVYGLLPEAGGATKQDVLTVKGVKVGDVITVVGPKGSYKESPQMVNAYYESHVSNITVAEFNALPDGDTPYVLTGKVANVANAEYGNFDLVDATGSVYVYGLYDDYTKGKNDRVKVFTEKGIKEGDTITLFGPKTTYKEKIEVNGSTYVLHEAGEGPGPGASITVDGNPGDWDNLAGVASAKLPSGAELGGIKSAKVYYGDKLFILAEFSDEALAKGKTDGKLRFHVFFSGDNGLLKRFWADENIAYMLEGKATSGGAYTNFSSSLYKFTGATSADWSWTDSQATLSFESAGNGNFYELAIDYANYPGGFPAQVEIGIDCADGDYNVLGFAPQTSHKFTLKKGEAIDRPDDPDPGADAPATIAQIIKAIPATATGSGTAVEFTANLAAPAVVSYVNGNNAYIQDETGAILLYLKDHGLKAGDTVKGKLAVKAYWYNGIPEMVAIGSEYEKAAGDVPAPKVITIAELLANYDANLLRLIALKGITVTDAIADGDRNGEVSQGSDKIKVYCQLNNKGLTLPQGANGDLVTIPGLYNDTKQVYFWDNGWFTEAVAANIKVDGDLSDWANVEGVEAGSFKEFKYSSDKDNLYFYFKIKRSKIIAAKTEDPEGSGKFPFNWRRYIAFGIDTDNNAETGTAVTFAGMNIPGCEAGGNFYPFRGNATSASGTDGVQIVNGVEEQGGISTAITSSVPDGAADKATVFGQVDDDFVYIETQIARTAIGSPAAGTANVQLSLAWDLTDILAITLN